MFLKLANFAFQAHMHLTVNTVGESSPTAGDYINQLQLNKADMDSEWYAMSYHYMTTKAVRNWVRSPKRFKKHEWILLEIFFL